MKKIFRSISVLIMLCALMFGSIQAKGRSEKVTFSRDMVLNGTVIKKGTYRVSLDDQSKEMTIWDGKTEVARAAVRLENLNRKTSKTEVIFTEKDNRNYLNRITFPSSTDTIIVNNGANETATPQ
jgi:hypothetical protein